MVLLIIIVFLYIKSEHFIYFWDYSNYFNKYLYINRIFSGNSVFGIILDSIKHDDYNLVPVLPLLLTRSVFGASRLAYIESVFVLYITPALLTIFFWVRKYLNYKSDKHSEIWILLLLLSIIPPVFFGPAIRGYLDVIVVVPIVFTLTLTLKIFKENANVSDYLLIGAMLFIGPLLRRWTLYFSVAYLISLFLVFLTKFFAHPKNYKKYLSGLIWMSNVILILIYVFKPEFIYGVDMGFIGSLLAYKDPMNVFQKEWEQILGFGFYYFIPLIFGMGVLLYDFRKSFYELFLLSTMLMTYLLFTNMQDMGDNQAYLVLPMLMFFSIVGVYKIFKLIKNSRLKPCYLLGLFSFQILVYLFVFIPHNQFLKIRYIFPDTTYYPLVRSDIGEIDRLIQVISSVRNKDEKVYVLASSWILNDSVIENRVNELGLDDFAKNVMFTTDVDKRDGFPEYFFDAKYIITSAFVEVHLYQDEQKNLYILHKFIENHPEYYVKIGECFELENGVCGEIYQLQKNVPKEEIKNLESNF